MPLTAYLHWKALDKSLYFNTRLADRSIRGVFMGGLITTVPGVLRIEVGGDFGAVGHDGMVVRDVDGVGTPLNVTAGITQWVVCYAKHQTNANPIMRYEVISDASYATHIDQEFLIVIGRITLAPAAIQVTAADIDYSVRDTVDPISRLPYRGSVELPADLPTSAPIENRDGDIYFVRSTNSFYQWEALTPTTGNWVETTATSLSTAIAIFQLAYLEKTRREEKSGVIAGDFTSADERHLPIVEQPSADSRFDLANVSALVNGHFLYLPYTRVQLAAKPGGGTRWDGVWLEVWRELVADPTTLTFPEAPGGGGAVGLQTANDLHEGMMQSGTDNANSVYLYSVEAVADGDYVATYYSMRTVSNVGATVYRHGDLLMSDVAVLNPDLNPYIQAIFNPGGPLDDLNVWFALYAASYDGVSWAIPMFVVRRIAAEDHLSNQGIMRRRIGFPGADGLQQIFDVYPYMRMARHDLVVGDVNRRQLFTGVHYDAYSGIHEIWNEQYRIPSGIMHGHKEPIAGRDNTGVALAANTVHVPEMDVHIHGRLFNVPAYDVNLYSAPAVGHRRDLVTLELRVVKYPTGDHVYDGLSPTPRALEMTGDAGHEYYIHLSYNVYDVASDLTVEDAMGTAGFTVSTKHPMFGNTDDGLWYSADTDTTYRVNLTTLVQAIPIALVHRRNQAVYHANTNPNGVTGRPDGFTEDVIEKGDILDARSYVCTNRAELEGMLQDSFTRLLQGRLRTAMVQHPLKADVAGLTHLYLDSVTNGGAAKAGYNLISNGMDGIRGIWSDAIEYYPACFTGVLAGNTLVDPDGLVDYTYVAGPSGSLTLTAPAGSYIFSSSIPGPGPNPPPVWTDNGPWEINSPAVGNSLTTLGAFNSWTETAWDANGNPTQIVGDVVAGAYTNGDTYSFSFVVVYDRSYTLPYSANKGAYALPDKLLRVATDGWGEQRTEPPAAVVKGLYTGAAGTTTIEFTQVQLAAAAGLAPGSVVVVGFPYMQPPGVLAGFVNEPLNSLQWFPRINVVGREWQSYTVTLVEWTLAQSLRVTIDVQLANEMVELLFPYVSNAGPNPDLWAELARGTKAFQGFYGWAYADVTATSDPFRLTVADFTFPGYGAPPTHALFRREFTENDVFIWWDNAGIWEECTPLQAVADRTFSGSLYTTGYTAVLQVSPLGMPLPTDFRIWALLWAPPESTDAEILIEYLGTPYAGMTPNAWLGTPALSYFEGEVQAVSDTVLTTRGPGVSRWAGVAAGPPEQFTPRIGDDYAGINPALSYIPTLDAYDWKWWDNYDIGGAYFMLPQCDLSTLSTLSTVNSDPWDIDGALLSIYDFSNEYSWTVHLPTGSGALSYVNGLMDGDPLHPGLVITRPDNMTTAWFEPGETNGGMQQGTALRRTIASFNVSPTISPGTSVTDLVDFSWYRGLPMTDASGDLYYRDAAIVNVLRPSVCNANVFPRRLLGLQHYMSVVGYFVKHLDTTYHHQVVMLVFTSRPRSTSVVPPGAAMDAFTPMHRPLISMDPSSGV